VFQNAIEMSRLVKEWKINDITLDVSLKQSSHLSKSLVDFYSKWQMNFGKKCEKKNSLPKLQKKKNWDKDEFLTRVQSLEGRPVF
jgi:hypothetical protein